MKNWRETNVIKLKGLLRNEETYIEGLEKDIKENTDKAFDNSLSYLQTKYYLSQITSCRMLLDRAKMRKNKLVYQLREAQKLLDLYNNENDNNPDRSKDN